MLFCLCENDLIVCIENIYGELQQSKQKEKRTREIKDGKGFERRKIKQIKKETNRVNR